MDNGLLDNQLLQYFDYAMKMREGADYGHIYSTDTALELVNSASKIYENSKQLLKQ